MRIALITGSYPPDCCGVGDYSFQLTRALQERGILVDVVNSPEWSAFAMRPVVSVLRRSDFDVVHLQYPTTGYGHNLGPQALALAVPGIVTIHEFTRAHPLRKASLIPLTLRARHVIFISQAEQEPATRLMPWVANRSSIIPIGSSIPAATNGRIRNWAEIVYFGLIAPRKGLEEVVRFAELVKARRLPLCVRIIGGLSSKHQDYQQRFFRRSEGLPIRWCLNADPVQVADWLSAAAFAYLPFPDGASESRSSLKAILSAGVVCMTRCSTQTPQDLAGVVECASSPEEALIHVQALQENRERWHTISQRSRDYASRYSWERIAATHIELYEKIGHCRRAS